MSDEAEKAAETTAGSSEKMPGAKSVSLIGQIIAAVWIAGWSAFKFIKVIIAGQFAELGITDIIFSAFSIAACFAPVYFSIIMDKIKDIRFGGNDK